MTLTQTVTWIPCAERLPELKKRAIITTPEFPVALVSGFTCTALWDGERWMRVDDEERQEFGVVYWAAPLKHPAELEGK